jgi:serine/threonine protein kinase
LDDNAASEFVSGALSPGALTRVEGHLAGCRECRTLVAALAADAAQDSNANTVRHERESESQVAQRPRKVLTVGDRVGRYLVLSALGAGGMGVVFAAYDPQLDRKVALKLLRGGHAETRDARTRLRREAQAIAQLSHPNVVSVYDVGTTDDDDLYIAMEFVEGDTLTSWLRRYPRTWREIVEVFLQAARGLVAAHGVGLLHRDFKPDNVLVGGDGRVRVTDFGLARSLLGPDEASRPEAKVPTALSLSLTATGTVLGTPRYMPPEQLTGPDIDARSDQFSFCVALYEALYGAHPLTEGTSSAMLEKGARANPPPEGTKVPAAIGRAVLRGLERDRTKRFSGMAALMTELAPRPAHSPLRTLSLVGAAVAVVGLATAAVIWERPGPPMQTYSGDPIGPLILTINKLNDEIKQLNRDRTKLLQTLEQNKQLDQHQIVALQTALAAKDQQIQDLVAQVSTLQTHTIAAKPVVKLPSQTMRIFETVPAAQHPVEGCFDEWSQRTEQTDAMVVVTLTVSPDGTGHAEGVTGIESELTKECISEQIAGLRFPEGPAVVDLEVTALYSEHNVNLSPRAVGYHDAPKAIDE